MTIVEGPLRRVRPAPSGVAALNAAIWCDVLRRSIEAKRYDLEAVNPNPKVEVPHQGAIE